MRGTCEPPTRDCTHPPTTDIFGNRLERQTDRPYLGEVAEYGCVVFQASEERPFHAIDGDGAHVRPPLVEPRVDEGSSRGIAFAEQRRHRGIGEWLCARFGKVQRRTRQGGAGKAMVLDEGNGKFQEPSSANFF